MNITYLILTCPDSGRNQASFMPHVSDTGCEHHPALTCLPSSAGEGCSSPDWSLHLNPALSCSQKLWLTPFTSIKASNEVEGVEKSETGGWDCTIALLLGPKWSHSGTLPLLSRAFTLRHFSAMSSTANQVTPCSQIWRILLNIDYQRRRGFKTTTTTKR